MLPQTILIQNSIALLLVISVAVSRSASRTEAAIRLMASWTFLIGLVLAGLWISPPPISPWMYCGGLVVASGIHYFRTDGKERVRLVRYSHIPTLLSMGLGFLLLWQGLIGRTQPEIDTINLAAPMPRGKGVCVLSGGNSLALNAHFQTAGTPIGFKEIHAVDFVKVRSGGYRTISSGIAPQPRDITEYLVFDEPVFAPCDGTIVEMKNDHPDHPAGAEFRDRSGVNYVTLRCEAVDVIMAHLKRGSIEVSHGQTVSTGDLIGTVGNSGNTEEPHLHIQAQTVLPPNSERLHPLPVAMIFDGQYMSRGDCL